MFPPNAAPAIRNSSAETTQAREGSPVPSERRRPTMDPSVPSERRRQEWPQTLRERGTPAPSERRRTGVDLNPIRPEAYSNCIAPPLGGRTLRERGTPAPSERRRAGVDLNPIRPEAFRSPRRCRAPRRSRTLAASALKSGVCGSRCMSAACPRSRAKGHCEGEQQTLGAARVWRKASSTKRRARRGFTGT